MIITSVEKNKRNKGRYSVYIDDQYSFSVSEEDYLSLNLYEKKEVTNDEVSYIRNTVNFNAAKSAAVRCLVTKARSGEEVSSKLKDEGFDRDTVEKVIEELQAIGYINDTMYAQKFIFDRAKLKPVSKKMLEYELRKKGVSIDVINEVLEEWKVDESSVAESLVRKKFGKYDLKDEKIVRKVYSFLQHRGFSFELIGDIIEKIRDDK